MSLVGNWITGLCLLALTAAGCGGGSIGIASIEGGPVGSGLSASVSGNVVAVAQGGAAADTSGADAAMMVAVNVSIDEVPGLKSTTDADGNFELEGNFSGALTLRFKTTMFDVAEVLHVPAGSTIVLEDVELGPRMVRMGAVRQLGFAGVVANVNCGAGVLLVNDQRSTATQFTAQLSSATTIVDGNGKALQCAAVRSGQQVVVRGTIPSMDKTVMALGVIVGPQSSESVQFTGWAMTINCQSGVLMVSDPAAMSAMPGMSGMPGMGDMPGMVGMAGKARVRLSSATTFTDAGGQPLQCGDVRAGQDVAVSGVIDNQKPGVIDAQTIKVSTSP